MKYFIPLLYLIFFNSKSSNANPQSDTSFRATVPPEIEDVQLLGINKEPAHATLMPYANIKEALTANRHASSLCQSLNGQWKFNWVPRPQQRPEYFYQPTFDVSGWKEITVPSNWQVQGYGTPFYRNMGYTFKTNFPLVMNEPPKNFTSYKERNPVGSYRRNFEVPAAWNGNHIFITFDGVDAGFFLWINGNKVGYSVNSRNAAEFDITKYIKAGANIIAVEVYQYTSGSYMEDQDMWRLNGIFRNVTLWAAPNEHIRDFFIKTELDKAYQNATVIINATIKNYNALNSSGRKLMAFLYDGEKKIAGTSTAVYIPPMNAGEEKIVALKFDVTNPKKWTAETPKLYTILLELADEKSIVERLSSRVGFRKIELINRQFLINGQPIKLKGVNRHEHWPEVGHAITEAQMIKDLEVIKQGNCNHVRTCHYSDDPRWYELCDEWGIWVLAEANVEMHGLDNKLQDDPRLTAAIVDRNVTNVENFKNHPSVIIWSLGNESGKGALNFKAALDAIKKIDTERPVHYCEFNIGTENPADIDSRMYSGIESVEKSAQDKNLVKPYYLCEFAHSMFNSMGSLKEYNDLFDKYPSLLGGAIWEYQDQGLWNRRNPAHPILAYGGGFGEFPNNDYFIHKGVVASDRSAKPQYPEMKRVFQWIGINEVNIQKGIFKIKNKYQFIDLSSFIAEWSLSENGITISRGKFTIPPIEPGKERDIRIPYAIVNQKMGSVYYLRISFHLAEKQRWAAKGFEVAAQQFLIPAITLVQKTYPLVLSPLKFDTNNNTINIYGKDFSISFDKLTGTISGIEKNGSALLEKNGGPVLHLWRAPHYNDDMWANKNWEATGVKYLKWETENIDVFKTENGSIEVNVQLHATGKKDFKVFHEVKYIVYGDGHIHVINKVKTSDEKLALGRIGVRLFLKKELNELKYFGRGPMENYADRKTGSDISLYNSTVQQQLTPYEKPMDCGNHEDVRWMQLLSKKGSGFRFIADSVMQFTALPYSDEEMENVQYRIDLPKSKATVLTINHQTLGVGSNSCGPSPLAPYKVYALPTEFSYDIRVF